MKLPLLRYVFFKDYSCLFSHEYRSGIVDMGLGTIEPVTSSCRNVVIPGQPATRGDLLFHFVLLVVLIVWFIA